MISSEVTIVIPFHNSVHWLELCLINLNKFGILNSNECIVVNDRSNNYELEIAVQLIGSYKKNIKIVGTKNNPGYGATCNFGVSIVNTKFALLLNTDCLITDATISKLLKPHKNESNILMTCPLSNNSPNYTFPIANGLSFYDIDKFLTKLFSKQKEYHNCYDVAHTIVGNCLLINVDSFKSLDGFSDQWGIGYGEETDLQYRGEHKGMRSMVVYDSYVYHYGGASFDSISNIAKHKKSNYKKFLLKWGTKYFYEDSLPRLNVIDYLHKIFNSMVNAKELKYEILFYLPIINQQIGGVHSIIDICNELILSGVSANCILVGTDCDSQYASYLEYMLFKPFYYSTDQEFLINSKEFQFDNIVSTVHTSAELCSQIAKNSGSCHIQYVQGVEYMFENGMAYANAINSYKFGSKIVFASHFLMKKLKKNFICADKFYVIKPKVNKSIFFKRNKFKKEFFLGFCLRHVRDKGQSYLINLIQNDLLKDKSICIFGVNEYKSIFSNMQNVTFISLPINKVKIAEYLSDIENYIDLSLHEGFGLMAYEALLCGCRILSTNSGGVTDYMSIDDYGIIKNPLDDIDIVTKLFNSSWTNIHVNSIYNSWNSLLNE